MFMCGLFDAFDRILEYGSPPGALAPSEYVTSPAQPAVAPVTSHDGGGGMRASPIHDTRARRHVEFASVHSSSLQPRHLPMLRRLFDISGGRPMTMSAVLDIDSSVLGAAHVAADVGAIQSALQIAFGSETCNDRPVTWGTVLTRLLKRSPGDSLVQEQALPMQLSPLPRGRRARDPTKRQSLDLSNCQPDVIGELLRLGGSA